MVKENKIKSALPPYRVLDLTEGGCMLGGRMLGDLGADVIKIEPPGGSPSRIAPYYKNIADPEKSLFWFAYNANKRGITLDFSKSEGQTLFNKIVKTADIILESFEPGYLGTLKLGYADLCQIKPDIIVASITPFGQRGPKVSYKGSDLTAWASGGFLYTCGNPDRAPVWISFPQAGFFGGAEGAIGSIAAMWHRLNTGEGQYVDVSLQECAIAPTLHVLQMWDVAKVQMQRNGGNMYVPSTGVRQPIYFKCADGYVMILVQGGNEPFVSSSKKLVSWMQEEGMAPEWFQKLDWRVDYNAATLPQETADRVETAIEIFTLTKTKLQLLVEGSIKRGIFIAPVNNTKDISEDRQLEARVYWRKLEHPELNTALAYCGPSVRMSETPIEYKRQAPLVGEHNREIYTAELGLIQAELNSLREKAII
jgi:crotonobetainyl-CoA:carnitine CoA-transferase CaiB-like acyl-CoA transferase